MIELNINCICEVILRARGVQAIKEDYEKRGLEPPGVKVGDTFRESLWQIMLVLGPACYMGLEPPFDINIKIEEEPTTLYTTN